MSNSRPQGEENTELNLRRFNKQSAIKLESNDYLRRQAEVESNARSYPRNIPIAIKRAKGIFIEDTAGQLFIDCLAGAGTLALGHNHPEVHNALKDYLESDAPLHTLDITTPAKDKFIEQVFEILPAQLKGRAKVQFCGPTGADAVEAALKLVKTATQRGGIWAFNGAYHGMTHATLAAMGNLKTKGPVKNLMPEVHFLPYPNLYRCPFGLEGEQSVKSNLTYIENLLSDPHSGVLPPASIIVEAIQGEGGVVTAPVEWLKGLREITHEYDIPLIFDEVQSGIGRTGKMFAFEHAGIVPDVIVMSKAIGGGLPMSLVVYDERLDKWAPGAHTGTFRGNQLGMLAGTKTLQYICEHNLATHADKMGKLLVENLTPLAKSCRYIGEIRGKGLMIGVEIVDVRDDKLPPDGQVAEAIQLHCLQSGLILETGGRDGSTLRFLPPLIITEEEINKVSEIFIQSVETVVAKLNKLDMEIDPEFKLDVPA